jgi:SAM-dependent methyltransferase
MKVLDIGCDGKKYASPGDEVVGLDIQKFPDVDVIFDLEKAPMPFPDEAFDMVHSNHNLEHINNRVQLMDEIWRVLKPGGTFDVTVPHHSNPIGKRLDHQGYFSMQAFDSLVPGEKEKYIRGKFVVVERHIRLLAPFRFLEGFVDRYPDFYEWRFSTLIPAVEVHFKLKKV